MLLVSGNRDPQHSILQDLVDLKSRTSLSCLRSRCMIHVSGHPRIPTSPHSSVSFLVAGSVTSAFSDGLFPNVRILPCCSLGCRLSGGRSKASRRALPAKLWRSTLQKAQSLAPRAEVHVEHIAFSSGSSATPEIERMYVHQHAQCT